MSTNKKEIIERISLPNGLSCTLDESVLAITGPKGTTKRNFFHPLLRITIEENSVILKSTSKKFTKKEKKILKTFKAHLKNMITGITEGFVYHLKIVSGHFPMNVILEGTNKIVIKNFLGEKVPRSSRILPKVNATIKNDLIIIESVDKEAAGQTAANLETATRITNRDRRVFQDGIFITNKPMRQK